MEPRVFTRGNLDLDHTVAPGDRASMEPRVSTRGNRPFRYPTDRAARASMEPRVFTRGNGGFAFLSYYYQISFNGATRVHAWK